MEENVKPRQRELSLLIKETECRFPSPKACSIQLAFGFPLKIPASSAFGDVGTISPTDTIRMSYRALFLSRLFINP